MLELLKIVLVSDLEGSLPTDTDATQLSAATYLNTSLLDRLEETQPLELLQFLSSLLLAPEIKNLHKRMLERFIIALIAKLNACKPVVIQTSSANSFCSLSSCC